MPSIHRRCLPDNVHDSLPRLDGPSAGHQRQGSEGLEFNRDQAMGDGAPVPNKSRSEVDCHQLFLEILSARKTAF